MTAPALSSIAACCGGSATSAAVDFLVPGLGDHHFIAWGGDGGAVNIGRVKVRGCARVF
jgi:hypothetical protein